MTFVTIDNAIDSNNFNLQQTCTNSNIYLPYFMNDEWLIIAVNNMRI